MYKIQLIAPLTALLLIVGIHCNYAQTCPSNVDFELGNFTNWSLSYGTCCPISTPSSGGINGRHVITSGTGTDPYGGFPVVAPGGGVYSMRLGNQGTGARAERATYTLHVPNNINNYSLVFRYAVVFQDPGHPQSQQPRFEVKAYDSATSNVINCSEFTYIATSSLPGFSQSSVSSQVWYKSWTTASLNLSGYAGRTVYIDFANGDCAQGAHFGYGYVDLNCGLFQIEYNACDTNSTVTLNAPPGFQYYTWKDTSNWSTVDTGATVTITKPTTTTTYGLILTPYTGFGCADTLYTTIAINNLSINATNDTTVCSGDTLQLNAGATANATPITYQWSPGTAVSCDTCATPVTVPTSATTYYVTATDANGCSASDTVVIGTSNPTLSASVQDVICYNDSTGSIAVNSSGGITPYTYSWNTTPAKTTSTISNLTAGNYIVTALDSIGCDVLDTFTVHQPNTYTSSISTTDAACNSSSTGTASVLPQGGTTPYTYSWNTTPAQTNATATGLAAGNYIVTITDSNGCKIFDTTTIAQPDSVVASITNTTPVSCNGGNNGAATATATGGHAPYSYSWNTTPTQTTATATGLSSGTYIVTVTDSSGCSDTTAVIITQPSPLNVYISAYSNVACNGNNDGTATVTVTGGKNPYQYSWSTSPTQTTNTATSLGAGTYTVLVTDTNSCTDSATVNISEPTTLVAALSSSTNVSCYGDSNGAATINVTGGTTPYTYSWNTTPTQTTASISGVTAGSYAVVVTDSNGCKDTVTTTISQPSLLSASITATTDISCNGGNNGAATVTATGGTTPYTYSWATTPTQTNASATNLSAGSYPVTITDTNGCIAKDTAIIAEPNILDANISASNNISCNGGNNGAATVSINGGTAPYTYSWNTIPIQTGTTATGLTAGIYIVTVTDNNNCADTAMITITEPAALNLSIAGTTNILCNGGSNGTATTSVSGGTTPYTYSWNSVPTQTGANATGLGAGTYTVIVTDSNACADTATAVISEPTTLNTAISATTNVSCYGDDNGSASIVSSGGTLPYTYSWNTIPVQTTATATGLGAGNHTVIITDSNGCKDTLTAAITEPQALSTSISKADVSCNGGNNGSATANVSGGTTPYTYAWNTIPTQNNGTATALSAGNYSVLIIDGNGCKDTADVTINQSSALNTSLTKTDVLCNGGNNATATIIPSGGVTPYTYSWSTTPTQSAATATGLSAGTYTVAVVDSNGCSDTASITITQPTALNAGISNTKDISCNGGNDGIAIATASGGTSPYTYSWNTTPNQNSDTAINLTAGTHTVIITDSNGCKDTTTTTLAQPTPLTANGTTTAASCYDQATGSATITAGGGTSPYTYSWNTAPVQTTATATGLLAGNYIVTITDSNGCTLNDTMTVAQPTALSGSINTTNVSCNGDTNGVATVTMNGGTSPYTYSWNTSPIQTTASATGLSTGSYIVYVLDNNGCKDTLTTNITEPPQMVTTQNLAKDVTCNKGSDGAASIQVTGGTAPYTYNWSISAPSSPNINNLSAGTYTVDITDNNGCKDSTKITIKEPPAIKLTVEPGDKTCIGENMGSAHITLVNGGTPPYTYQWNTSPTQTSLKATGLPSGSYNVTVTDSNGCTTTESVTVGSYPELQLNLTSDQDLCEHQPIQLNASGATFYTWYLNTSSLSCLKCNNPIATPDETTTYYLAGLDTNGCKDTASVTITVLKKGVTDIGPDLDICLNESIELSATGGVEYTWLPNEWLSNNKIATPTTSTKESMEYTVIVKQNDCFTDTLYQKVNVHPLPTVELGPDIYGSITGASFQLHAETTLAEKIKWSPAEDLSCDNCFDPVARSVGQTTTYEAIVTSNMGCIASDEVTIHVQCDGSVFTMPNTFTPNADGLNDVFWPITKGLVHVDRMSIYNRWGEKLYEAVDFPSNDKNYGWDGSYKSKVLSPDVFVYIIEFTCASGQKIMLKGDISLIR